MTKKGSKQEVNKRSPDAADAGFGKKIRLLRVERGMSQEALADKLGLSFQQVQKYEKGTNRVGASRLQQVAKALDVPVTVFYGGDKNSREFETLMFADSSFSFRLLRAYNAIQDKAVARHFVTLMESVAAQEEGQA